MRYLIKNGSIIDPAQRVATVGSVLIEDGKLVQIIDLADMAANVSVDESNTEVINARGAVIAPGFIDLHTYLREPGEEQKETIATGTRAAAQGGFTTLLAMPATTPVMDNAAVVRQLHESTRRRGVVRVEPVGALTVGRQGRTLAELAELAEAGCVAFSDADRTVTDASVMRNALAYAAMLGLPVLAHAEDPSLARGWAMHEGPTATRLGLAGYPSAAEEMIVARDIALAELTGAHLHLCQISTAGSVALVRAAKERGVHVTAEVSPHHITLSDRWVLGSLARWSAPTLPSTKAKSRKRRSEPGLGLPSWLDPERLNPYNPSTRLNPPLRSDEDVEALIEGLRDGTIDVIATGHAPHSRVEKECEYGMAAPGISGLETALGQALTLVHRGELDLVQLIAKFTEGPATVLGRAPATLRLGSRADIVIFDPDMLWTVDPKHFASLGRSTPLVGQQLKGQVMFTMSGGKIVFRRGNFGIGTGVLRAASRIEGLLDED